MSYSRAPGKDTEKRKRTSKLQEVGEQWHSSEAACD